MEAGDEDELRAFAADDPVVTTGTGTIEAGKKLGGLCGRGRPASCRPGISLASERARPARSARGVSQKQD